jgi:GWxTD domain-containing protein
VSKRFIFFLMAVSLILPSQGIVERKSIKELPPKFKRWLEEEVIYIISGMEREVFLQLQTDRERESFIGAFWNHKDPTPGTPKNEFKEEHYRRINYANRYFGRGVPIPGWKTDRGRMYILLGEPLDTERLIGETQIYNTEIWFYQGLTKYGLPAGFNLVFYQKQGSGEYVLYSPTADGPQALMTSYFGDQANYLEAFRALRKINPTLARTSLSLIPGEETSFGRPSLASDLLIQQINNVPQKQFKDRYAEKFLRYKDIVEVEYTANYIDNDSLVRVIKDSSGIYFVHYVVELMKFSVHLYQGKYVTNIKINGKATDFEGKIIYQYEGSIPVEFNETQLQNISYKPFDLYDMFPLLPGNYKLSILVKNEVSKEFTSLEKDITIPEGGALQMSTLLLGYKANPVSPESKKPKPLKIGLQQIYCQPKKIFLPQDKLFLGFQIIGLSPGLKKRGVLKFEFFKDNEQFTFLTKKVGEYQDKINFKEEFLLQEFPPGYYRLKVSLWDAEQEILSERENFEVSPAASLPRPWVYSRTLLPPDDPAYAFILGGQYFSKGEIEKARIQMEKAYHQRPNSMSYALNLARVYFRLKEYEKIKEILLPFSESSQAGYDVYFLLGRAHQARGEFNRAISIYNKAVSHFGININLLNSLGECYYRLGELGEALAAWEKSLEINPEQAEIKEKVKTIKK